MLLIADQQIGRAQRESIHRAADDHAVLLHAVSAQILYRRQQSRLDNDQAHRDSTSRLSNSARSIGRNRTISPALSSVGGMAAGKNNGSGVFPISCQPPGVTIG